MRDSELAALESMRRHRVSRTWLLKLAAYFAAMVALWWLL